MKAKTTITGVTRGEGQGTLTIRLVADLPPEPKVSAGDSPKEVAERKRAIAEWEAAKADALAAFDAEAKAISTRLNDGPIQCSIGLQS